MLDFLANFFQLQDNQNYFSLHFLDLRTTCAAGAESSPQHITQQNISSNSSQQPLSHHAPPPQRSLLRKGGVSDHIQRYYNDEKTMILEFQSFVQLLDPDMIIGYEVQMLSWGYLIERARSLDINLCPMLSRIPSGDSKSKVNENTEQESFYFGHSLEFKITGRILLNVWRIMRSEVSVLVCVFVFVFVYRTRSDLQGQNL